MPNRNADGGRTPLTGGVDFTLMYVARDAFTRDLQRLTSAAGPGRAAADALGAAGRGRPGGMASWDGDRPWNT